MSRGAAPHWLVASGIIGLVIVTSACPVPIRYTQRLAPALTGVVRDETGAPVRGLALAVSTHADCRRPTAVGTTDSAGSFHIPASDHDRRLAWIGPFEFPPPRPFYVCADSTDASPVVFTGGVPVLPLRQPPLPVDSLTCKQSREENRIILRCESLAHQRK